MLPRNRLINKVQSDSTCDALPLILKITKRQLITEEMKSSYCDDLGRTCPSRHIALGYSAQPQACFCFNYRYYWIDTMDCKSNYHITDYFRMRFICAAFLTNISAVRFLVALLSVVWYDGIFAEGSPSLRAASRAFHAHRGFPLERWLDLVLS